MKIGFSISIYNKYIDDTAAESENKLKCMKIP